MQMAKIKGYKVIGTTSKSKEAIGRATGVDELIVCDEAPGTSFEDYTRCSRPPTPQPPTPLAPALCQQGAREPCVTAACAADGRGACAAWTSRRR